MYVCSCLGLLYIMICWFNVQLELLLQEEFRLFEPNLFETNGQRFDVTFSEWNVMVYGCSWQLFPIIWSGICVMTSVVEEVVKCFT